MSNQPPASLPEISDVEDLTPEVAVKIQREMHVFQWYTETRWFTRLDSGGILLLEPDTRDEERRWSVRLYPESRGHDLQEYFGRGEIDVAPHVPRSSPSFPMLSKLVGSN